MKGISHYETVRRFTEQDTTLTYRTVLTSGLKPLETSRADRRCRPEAREGVVVRPVLLFVKVVGDAVQVESGTTVSTDWLVSVSTKNSNMNGFTEQIESG